MVDFFAQNYPDTKEFATHINGCKRIDYLVCTENMVEFITKIGYIPFHEAIDSDHRRCYCDISDKTVQ
jgi:hypothetical protein